MIYEFIGFYYNNKKRFFFSLFAFLFDFLFIFVMTEKTLFLWQFINWFCIWFFISFCLLVFNCIYFILFQFFKYFFIPASIHAVKFVFLFNPRIAINSHNLSLSYSLSLSEPSDSGIRLIGLSATRPDRQGLLDFAVMYRVIWGKITLQNKKFKNYFSDYYLLKNYSNYFSSST